MLKFIWGRGQGPTAEMVKMQKELFKFSKNVTFGFPHKPSCMAWDPKLQLLVVCTKLGLVRVFGQPSVEIIGQHSGDEVSVSQVVWLEGEARLITLTGQDNSLHMWELEGDKLIHKHSASRDRGRLQNISCLCRSDRRLLVGTEGGNIYKLQLANFSWEEDILYQDKLLANVPDNYKLNPGAVESLFVIPDTGHLVVGYARGLVLVWDCGTSVVVQTFISQQQLESVVLRDDSSLVSCHNDGSYTEWNRDTGEEVPNTPYGPYPCKSISKLYSSRREDVTWNIFSGGMPRASYGDKFTVSVIKNDGDNEDQHVVFDLTSKVIDFLVLEDDQLPAYMLILSEEELVCIDLISDNWPVIACPYMQSMHASAITTISQVNKVNNQLIDRLENLREGNRSPWPVTGGVNMSGESERDETVIVTGHEDGSVKFWMASDNLLTFLTTFTSSKYFKGEDDIDEISEPDEDDEEWPPFRKVGEFDPYSDDPRLSVKKVLFCGESGMLIVGGTAGQVLVCNLGEEKEEVTVVSKTEIVTDKDGFSWKGHKSLDIKTGPIKQSSGFQPSLVLQLSPPASITSVSLARQWGLLSVGTAHGLVVLDYNFNHVVTARSTLSVADMENADDNQMSRRKSLKKSLRESFRRLRKGRSQRPVKIKEGSSEVSTKPRSESPKPVERQVEARIGSEDGLGSMVRCLHFSSTYISSTMGVSPTLWAGTNTGQVLVFLLTITPTDKRKNDKVTAVLAKEIQLKHRAPVIDIEVQDAGGLPVDGPQPSYPAPHRVLITSEEQFKLFSLPNLKPCGKYKLTAHEGVRVRKVKSATFTSSNNTDYTENCLIYLANSGEVGILSLAGLRRQVSSQVIRKEDVVGIGSLSFSSSGNGLYMSSSSELQQISLSASNKVTPGGGKVVVERIELTNGDTDSQVDRQNQQNEREADRDGVKSSPREASNVHNETTVSEVSGDITLDSIRDHMSQTMRSDVGVGPDVVTSPRSDNGVGPDAGASTSTEVILTGGRQDGVGPDTVASTSTEVTVVEREVGTGRHERVETVSRTVETISVQTSQMIVSDSGAVVPSLEGVTEQIEDSHS